MSKLNIFFIIILITVSTTALIVHKTKKQSIIYKPVTIDKKKAIQHYATQAHVAYMKGNLETAASLYTTILDIDPTLASAHYNLGHVYKLQGNYDAALTSLYRAVKLKPDSGRAHTVIAEIYLIKGEWKKAWPEYIWHWKDLEKDSQFSLWKNEDINGKTVLLHAGQGLGDTVHFLRFAKSAKERGAHVICTVQEPLIPLVSRCDFIDTLISTKDGTAHKGQEAVPDLHASLLGVPMALNMSVDAVPAEPYLEADPDLVEYWQKKLKQDKSFRVGLCWSTEPRLETEKPTPFRKSIVLKDLYPLSTIQGIQFYSLQKDVGLEQIKKLPQGFVVHTFGPDFDEAHGRFMDTGALIKNMDLIITTDTSIAHVAGALGARVWLLIPKPADWRWMTDEHKTVWYPNMRLFRQKTSGDWNSVIEQVKHELAQLVG